MLELRVDTGAVTVPIVDIDGTKLGEFKFNPVDSSILSRFDKFNAEMSGKDIQDELKDMDNVEAVQRFDEFVKEQFDYLLGYPVSDDLFSVCGPLTVVSNGDFYFEKLMEGIGGLIQQSVTERLKRKMERIRKATEEYQEEKAEHSADPE